MGFLISENADHQKGHFSSLDSGSGTLAWKYFSSAKEGMVGGVFVLLFLEARVSCLRKRAVRMNSGRI
jgi:hypothetical protein